MQFRPIIALSLVTLTACAPNGGDRQDAVDGYTEVVYASYDATLTSTTAMQGSIEAFVASPSASTLDAAKQAWLDARDIYGQTEAYRFYEGPIDNATDGPEGFINAWPMDESYIDYIEVDGEVMMTGIINDTAVAIDEATLRDLNEAAAEDSISTGWHAIEFLLWGQDFNADGPGERSYTDYVDGEGFNADRRGAYLTLVTQMLIDDLTTVTTAWAPEGENYRASFTAESADASLQDIFKGIGTLAKGELAGERIDVAYSERSQEDEHSCFADNTLADIYANALGVQNVWLGRYGGTQAAVSLESIVAMADQAAADTVTNRAEECLGLINDIPAPFDQWLTEDVSDESEGRQAIQASIVCLESLGDEIVLAAAAIGYENLDISLE